MTPTSLHWACDIEADDLLDKATRIHCAAVINCITKEKKEFTDAESFRNWYDKSYILVGHNFISYDMVMLNNHWGADIKNGTVVDTYVLSMLFNPSYVGGHSLSAWGKRLNYPKGEHNDYSHYSSDMLAYCIRDTTLTAFLFIKLTERMRQVGFTEDGAKIEHLAWNIIQNKQRKNGFPFDLQKAVGLYARLRDREEELQNEIYTLWPPELRCVAEYKQAFKKDGTHSKQYSTHLGQFPKLEVEPSGSYRAFDYVTFNIGSPTQRIAKLLELGWTPTRLTKKGNPKIDEDSLLDYAELSGKTEVKALAKWIVINSRANMIRTWMNAYDENTKAIHGKLFIASTLRYRHASPNSANIPAVRLKKVEGKDEIQYAEKGSWTFECRDLWTSGDAGWSLVGIDGKGIQLRVLANYAYSEEFASRVLDGDPHTNNIQILGLANKAAAKKFLYTTLMGGGGKLLAADQAQFGSIFTERQGNIMKNKLIDSVPGFAACIKKLQKQLLDTGRIELCDGTPIIVPSLHMVIPYLLQGDESRLMKLALIYLDYEIGKAGISDHCKKVADIHDEWQWRVRDDYINRFIDLALPCFEKAGKYFNYRIPIQGDYKVGKTWAETH